MGKVARQQEESPRQTSPRTPTSSNSSTSSSNSTSNGGGGGGVVAASTTPPPSTPRGVARADANPYPTTFVQADPSSFKQVVQMLTGSAETAASRHHQVPAAAEPPPPAIRGPIPLAKSTGPKRPAFKLYERRHHSFKNLKAIGPLLTTAAATGGPLLSPGASGSFSPRKPNVILSPSLLDFPALTLSSPVTPLIPDPFNRPAPHPNSAAAALAEERAIAEKGFYLHPSPRTTPRDADPPRLLPLFPVASPRLTSGGPSTAATS